MAGLTPPLVAVTREERLDDRFSRAIEAAGGRILPLATVASAPPVDDRPLTDALSALPSADWIVFTSARAVDATCRRREWEEARRQNASRVRVAAVGHATAERLRELGVTPDLVPEDADGAGALAHAIAGAAALKGARVVWPRSDIARRELPERLAAHGAIVIDPVAYRTVRIVPTTLPEFLSRLSAGEVAAVAFLSPSSAQGLAAALEPPTLGPLVGRTLIASLGPTTSDAVRALEGRVDVEAPARGAASLAEVLMRRLAARHGDAA
jgi:uroporphyrinogen-III synthase/uroporphyrinogen III methyltransferase/synthase